jgi:AcrR family transcriptional regulator
MDQIVNTPKTKRGQATLDKICQAAETLFYDKGYNNTSIVDITNHAGIALGTFYIYFKDKYYLYKYLLLRYSHQIRKEISDATKGLKSRKESERIGLKTYLKYTRENKQAYNIIWESLYIDKDLFREYYETFAKRYQKGIVEAQKNGQVREFDPVIISYILMGISNFIGLKYVMFEEEDDDDRVIDQIIEILNNGMFDHNNDYFI